MKLDTTPIGRILNRFSKDIDTADVSLLFNLRMTILQFFRTLVAFTMISLETPIILAAIFPLVIIYYLFQRIYISTSRQLKRDIRCRLARKFKSWYRWFSYKLLIEHNWSFRYVCQSCHWSRNQYCFNWKMSGIYRNSDWGMI